MNGEQTYNNVPALVATSLGLVGIIFLLLFGFFHSSYGQTLANTTAITDNANPLVYHLSSSDP